MREVTIIADDLTGAADCAIAFAALGVPTFVSLGGVPAPASARVVAVDTDSRPLAPNVAADRARTATLQAFQEGTRTIYKKIDSTLRGNVGPEIAATYQAAVEAAQGKRLLVIAVPAFPGTGRTTRDGRVLVQGVPLEETEIWRSSGMTGPADLVAMLRLAGLATFTARYEGVQLGPERLARELAQVAAGGVEAVVCDAEDERDLEAIAEAGAILPMALVWAGSAGLARHLPRALGLLGAAAGPSMTPLPFQARATARSSGPLLFVVGSRSQVARAQVRQLGSDPGVETLAVSAEVLLEGERSAGWAQVQRALRGALEAGRDVVLVISEGGAVAGREREVAAAMGRLAASQASELGGLVATGGDIARAVLSAIGASGVHLVGEVEPGVPIGVTEEPWPLLVITKAGAFGTPSTLQRCRAALEDRRGREP